MTIKVKAISHSTIAWSYISDCAYQQLQSSSEAMSAVAAAARKVAERAPKAARTFKTSAVQHSGGHGHSTGGYDDYLHAEHMYSVSKMPHRKIKMAIACSSIVVLGFGIPVSAIQFQKSKTAA